MKTVIHTLSTVLATLALLFHGSTATPAPAPVPAAQVIPTSGLNFSNIATPYDVNHIAGTEADLEAYNKANGLLGASNIIETPVAVFHTSLANAISNSATSMTLVSGLTADGTTLASSTYSFVLDSGQPDQEFVEADCTNTSCTNMARGLSVVNGTSTIATNAVSHRRTTSVDIVDAPLLLKITSIINGISSFPNILTYLTAPTFTSGTQIIDKNYADGLAIAGAPNANTTTKGISQTATAVQVASSTAFGSTGAALYVPTTQASSSPMANVGAGYVPATQNDSKISPNYVATSSAYTYNYGATINLQGTTTETGAGGFLNTASTTLAATTTIAASNVKGNALVINTVPYQAPSSQGTANSVWTNNGAGVISWAAPVISRYNLISGNSFTANGGGVSYATSSVLGIPAGTLTASSTWQVTVNISTCTTSTSDCLLYLTDVTGATVFATCDFGNNSVSNLTGVLTFVGGNQTSLSSQTTLVSGWINIAGNTSNLLKLCQTTGTAAFNTANALNLVIVAKASGSQTTAVGSYSMIVNP